MQVQCCLPPCCQRTVPAQHDVRTCEKIQRAHGTCDWRIGARGVWGHDVVTFFLPPAVTLLHALESNANLAGFAETKSLRLPRVALHRARGLLAPCAQLIVLHLHDPERLVRCPRLLRNPGPAPTTSCAHNATTSCVDARTTAHNRANLALVPVAVASGCGQRHARVRSHTCTRAQPLRRSARWLGPAALRRTFCFGARPHPLPPVRAERFSDAAHAQPGLRGGQGQAARTTVASTRQMIALQRSAAGATNARRWH